MGRQLTVLVLALAFASCDQSGGDGGGGPPDVGGTGACFLSCTGRDCGDDGCGGSCGDCGSGATCAAGLCVVGTGQDAGPSLPDDTDVLEGEDLTGGEIGSEPDVPGSQTDTDGDGVPDQSDNCPDGVNPSQLDTDGDGVGNLCDSDDDGDGDPDETDCAPANPDVGHGGTEVCNGADDNCNGVADEGFPDGDLDGIADCTDQDTDGDGEADMTDCAPLDPFVSNLLTESCDAKDNDCDGFTDEEDATGCGPVYVDGDGDGYGKDGTQKCLCDAAAPGLSAQAGDCDDWDSGIHPAAAEACGGGDEDCDGEVDEEAAEGCTTVYLDGDLDGIGIAATETCVCDPYVLGLALLAGDCDDTNPDVGPLMLELCDDLDNDCDGAWDEDCDDDGDDWCDVYMPVAGNPATCPFGAGDCDDTSAQANPGMDELYNDGIDNDCDGDVDEGGPLIFPCPGGCTGQTMQAYLCAMEMCFDEFIVSSQIYSPTGDNISSAWAAVNHFGSPNNDLAPWAGNSYSLLASGPATGTSHSVDLPGGGGASDPFSSDGYTTYDNVELKVVVTAPPTAIGFSLDYIYFSEEYEEYIGSSYNDKFYIFLKAPQTTGNVKTVINTTDCSSPWSYWDTINDEGQKQCYIAINTAFSEPCSNVQTNISGTGFECGPGGSTAGSSTGWLTTQWSIQPNETFELTFHIHDTSDGIYDSEVILDNFLWLVDEFEEGTKPHS